MNDSKKYYVQDGFWFYENYTKIDKNLNDNNNIITGCCKKCGAIFTTNKTSRYNLDDFVQHTNIHEFPDNGIKIEKQPPPLIKGKMYLNNNYEWFIKHFTQQPSIYGVLTATCRYCNEFLETKIDSNFCLDKFDRHISNYHNLNL